ncbi:MAG: T9SS type A sorting domain-containing protein [Bacteroidetes bacterium]|nr:T9SS type A sorting domain-containing protein [Bacteroidota bacterium]
MKKLYIFLLAVISFIFTANPLQAQCVWNTVGTGAASNATFVTYTDISMASTNLPYITYCDGGATNALTVKTYSGSTWQNVGTLSGYTNAMYSSIAMNGTTPYVVFADGTSGRKARVMSYSAGSWSAVGTGTISADTALYTSMAVYGGTPYVVFCDRANGKKATLKKFSAGAWSTVGTAISTSTAAYTSVAFDASGTPYVGYTDVANSNKVTVMKFNGSTWAAVGTGTVSTAPGTYVNVAVNPITNIPYVSYVDPSAYLGYVKMFSAGSWQLAGGSSLGSVYQDMAMTFDGAGNPYVAYYHLSAYKCNVMKLSAGSWVQSGNADFSLGTPNGNNMVVDANGFPYVIYGDGASGAFVKKLTTSTTIIMNPASTTLCSGQNSTLSITTNSTTGITYQWQINTGTGFTNLSNGTSYSGVTTQSLQLIGVTTGQNGYQYACIFDDGCVSDLSNGALLTVNPTPTIAITGNSATVCAGTSVTLTASGASTYTWTSGVNTPTVAVSPAATTVYSVSGASAAGCTSIMSKTISVTASKTFSGTVSSTAGAVSGDVILYKYSPVLSKWDSVTFTPFSSIYSFGIIDSAQYVVKAVPTATNVQITYAASAISWQGAMVISHGCTSNLSQHIQVMPYTPLTAGTGSLSGHIYEGAGYGHKSSGIMTPGQPIPGVIVKGGKNPGASIFAQTSTDASGSYSLGNIPPNNPGESYFILVDIPGLDTNTTYHKTLTSSNGTIGGLDFVVDSMYVNPVQTTSVNDINKADFLVNIYPNPAHGQFVVEYSLLGQAPVSIELLNVVGQRVCQAPAGNTEEPGNHKHVVTTDHLSPGIYFVKLHIGQHEICSRLYITE